MAAATAEGAFDDLDDLDDWEAGDWTWDAPSDEDGRHPPHHHGQASRPEQPATATPARDTAEGRTAASDEDHDRTLDGRLALNPYKAGLQSADKERVNKIIYEASKVRLRLQLHAQFGRAPGLSQRVTAIGSAGLWGPPGLAVLQAGGAAQPGRLRESRQAQGRVRGVPEAGPNRSGALRRRPRAAAGGPAGLDPHDRAH